MRLEEPRPLEHHERAEQHADANKRGQYIEGQHHDSDALEDSPVRGDRRQHHQHPERDQAKNSQGTSSVEATVTTSRRPRTADREAY